MYYNREAMEIYLAECDRADQLISCRVADRKLSGLESVNLASGIEKLRKRFRFRLLRVAEARRRLQLAFDRMRAVKEAIRTQGRQAHLREALKLAGRELHWAIEGLKEFELSKDMERRILSARPALPTESADGTLAPWARKHLSRCRRDSDYVQRYTHLRSLGVDAEEASREASLED